MDPVSLILNYPAVLGVRNVAYSEFRVVVGAVRYSRPEVSRR